MYLITHQNHLLICSILSMKEARFLVCENVDGFTLVGHTEPRSRLGHCHMQWLREWMEA
jgi:hypothetical protein